MNYSKEAKSLTFRRASEVIQVTVVILYCIVSLATHLGEEQLRSQTAEVQGVLQRLRAYYRGLNNCQYCFGGSFL